MKIEVLLKEFIKPSFSTPDNYPNLDSNDNNLGDDEDGKKMIISVSSRLRWCGLYIEARVVGRVVSQVIQLASSDNEVMEPFLPYDPYGGTGSAFRRGVLHMNSKTLLKIQVNTFDCGEIVICLSYSHKIVDASSFTKFVKDWTATTHGGSDTHDDELKCEAVDNPCYMSSSIFPPAIQIVPDITDILTKRFVFTFHKTFLMFSSWCRFPVYEVDFGWAKTYLKKEEMVEFELHKELIALAS
ncbi:hypothetical protein MKW98_030756 [Papaver atlanticum]|uniref:Uncharacterized protein n=1 Tax=Papaver atlanticum TaxID=357466 RepID=A0AAD4S107_9MAGN|nr:hypothetical protein MKW98_030756 [Papaver atlanticum]